MQQAKSMAQASLTAEKENPKKYNQHMVKLKKSQYIIPKFDDKLQQQKTESWLQRQKGKLSSRESWLFNYVKHNDHYSVSKS